jgi:hypothetical protein
VGDSGDQIALGVQSHFGIVPIVPGQVSTNRAHVEVAEQFRALRRGAEFPGVRYAVMRDDLPLSLRKEFLTQQKSMGRISNSELEIVLEK